MTVKETIYIGISQKALGERNGSGLSERVSDASGELTSVPFAAKTINDLLTSWGVTFRQLTEADANDQIKEELRGREAAKVFVWGIEVTEDIREEVLQKISGVYVTGTNSPVFTINTIEPSQA